MSVIYQRYCVKSDDGEYFGGITTNPERVKKLLEMAREKHPLKNWAVICWID